MLEWTGERFLPWINEATIAYEHLHRYAYAARFVKNKRVIDLACGEGYGARILAETASHALGVDIDELTVQHATKKYGNARLKFVRGSITNVPGADDHSFDVAVCFEAIEHIDDHEKLLQEVKRLITPDGLFIVSTPNKAIYQQVSLEENPFHVKELEFEEFKGLLGWYFKHRQFLGQRIHPGSSIWPIHPSETPRVREFVIARRDGEFQFIGAEQRVPLYYIALASDAPEIVRYEGSFLVDDSSELLNAKDKELRDTKAASAEALNWREQQLSERAETIQSLEKSLDWREQQIKELKEGLEWTETEVKEREKTIASQEEGLAWRAHQVEDLKNETALLHSHLETTQRQLRMTTEQLEAIHASRGWKFILRLRHLRDKFKGLVTRDAKQ